METLRAGSWEYLVFPGASSPGVVLVHEIYGRDEYARSVAGQLSKQGFPVIAVDLFRGKHASDLKEGLSLSAGLSREEVLDCLSQALDLCRKRMGNNAIVGTMGFCMGGGYALLGACAFDFSFCVDYYGMIRDPADVEGLKGPVQLMLGSEDPRVPGWAYQEFLPAATRFRKRVDLHLYPGAGHAFHRPGWKGHHPDAARDAWTKTLTFLDHLKP